MAKIFVVDDDPTIRNLICKVLDQDGHTLYEFHDGAAALNQMHAENPDLVITDVYMPELDGLELINSIKKWNPDCKIICISLSGENSHLKLLGASKGLGADIAIEKPFEIEEIRNAVNKLLS